MRSILLHVYDDPCFEARLQVTLDLARQFRSHVLFVQPIPVNVALAGDPYGAFTAEMIPVLRENASKFRSRVEARIADEGIAWDWIEDMSPAGDVLMSRAALSDVIVLGACDPYSRINHSSLVGQIAIHSQTPILVVPASSEGFDCSAPVAIAWNGSPEASRSIKAALPLLAKATAVYLVTIAEEREARRYDLPPVEGGEFLSRHGIECELVEMPAADGSVANTLVQAAQIRRASCIVMGAYGHSRLQEIVLGGTTRKMLQDPPLPLFLCH